MSSSTLIFSFRALKLCGSGGPPHVKLIIEWEHRIKDWSVCFLSFYTPLHMSMGRFLRVLCNRNFVLLAAACLVIFTRRWWRTQRVWGISISSMSSSTAALWTSASSSTPKRSRYPCVIMQRQGASLWVLTPRYTYCHVGKEGKKSFHVTCECEHTLLRLCYACYAKTQLERFWGYLYHVKCLRYTSDMRNPQFVLRLLIKNQPASDKTQTLTEEVRMGNWEWMETWWFF